MLGPLEVKSRGHAVQIGSRLQRALLAALLLRRNTLLTTDELIDGLWERSPPTAHQSLLNHIGRLRRILPLAAIETVSLGYLLRTRPNEVDADRFLALRAASQQCDAPARAAVLRDAERLWRGRPLENVVLFGSLATDVDALDELRMTTVEGRMDAALEAGLHLELVSELEVLVAQNPERERLVEQLMVALYRSGRQADALGAYRAARRRLVEQLGLDPGEALVRLERAILAHDLPLSPRIRRNAPPSLLTKTIELAPGTYEQKAEFAYRLGIALSLLAEHEHADEVLEEARDRAEIADAREIALRAQLALDFERIPRGRIDIPAALDRAECAVREFRLLADDLGSAVALLATARLHRDLGQTERSLSDLRRAAVHSTRAAGTSWPTRLIFAVEAEVLFLGATPTIEAIERCSTILDSVTWGPPGPYGVYASLGMLHAMRGEFAAARSHLHHAAAACEEYGLQVPRIAIGQLEAVVEEQAGDLDAAESVVRSARAQLATADPAQASSLNGAHARLLALLGRGDEALATARAGLASMPVHLVDRTELLRGHALALSATGDTAAAVARAADAVQEVEATDLLAVRAESLLDLARVQASAGLNQAANRSRRRARTLFKRKGHLVGVKRTEDS